MSHCTECMRDMPDAEARLYETCQKCRRKVPKGGAVREFDGNPVLDAYRAQRHEPLPRHLRKGGLSND